MATNIFTNGDNLSIDSNISKIKRNREYLLSRETTVKLNTYTESNVFGAFNDLLKDNNAAGAVRSIFNKFSGVLIADKIDTEKIDRVGRAGSWRISNNIPLIDNRESRAAIKRLSGCSIKELVDASERGALGRATYDYSDFMYCKHLGKLPNNHLITLRRFPYPVDDYISSTGGILQDRTEKDASNNVTCLGCLITWLNTPGNDISNILKYSMSMPFEEKTAKFEDILGGDADSQKEFLPGVAALADERYREQYMAGEASNAANEILEKYFPKLAVPAPYNAKEYANWKDENKVYGPVDAIKSVYTRSEKGLQFDQDISLTFDYELRSYNGINGRQAFLDLLANILAVTYTTGTFWGGQYKSNGAHQNNTFTNFKIFSATGGLSSYINAFTQDSLTVMNNLKSSMSAGNVVKSVGNVLNQGIGMIIGGMLNAFGRPAKIYMNSLLTPLPVGFWHVMIGNPFHPIVSMGNMILKNTTIEHYGPLGLDDFPIGIKVTCTLTRGKPRDISEIERMYLNGNDRIYHPMGDKVTHMYYAAKTVNVEGTNDTELSTGEAKVTEEDLKNQAQILKKMFGHSDTSSIIAASKEMGFGSQKKDQGSRQLGVGN